MLKIFHTADIHIGAKTSHLKDELFDLQKKYLQKFCLEAQQEKSDFIIIAGDLFDSNYIPTKLASQIFEILLSTSTPTIIIPGGGSRYANEITGHDAYSQDSIYKRPELQKYLNNTNIKLLTPENSSIIISNTAFYAGFFEIPKQTRLNAQYHIGIIHGAFSENPLEMEISSSLLDNSFFDFICLGHYHSFKKFKKAVYPGTLVQFEFLKNKYASSGYVKISISNEIKVEYRHFKNAPLFSKVEIIEYNDVESIKQSLEKKNHFIEITGYLKEFEHYIHELSKFKNIIISDNAVVYERQGIYGIIEDSLDEILMDLNIDSEEISEEIKHFILRNIRINVTKPIIEDYLINKFLL